MNYSQTNNNTNKKIKLYIIPIFNAIKPNIFQ